MANLITNLPINIPPGTREFGPTVLADGATKMKISLKRCTTATPQFWPSVATKLDVLVQYSLNGGATWTTPELSSKFSSEGGIQTGPPGTPKAAIQEPVANMECNLPPGTNRRIKATTTVSGGTLVSELSLSTTP